MEPRVDEAIDDPIAEKERGQVKVVVQVRKYFRTDVPFARLCIRGAKFL